MTVTSDAPQAKTPIDSVEQKEAPLLSRQTSSLFTGTEGQDASKQRKEASEAEVSKGNIPRLDLDLGNEKPNSIIGRDTTDGATRIAGVGSLKDLFAEAKSGKSGEEQRGERSGTKHEHAHSHAGEKPKPGKIDAHGDHGEGGPEPTIVDRNPSPRFVRELRGVTDRVMSQMPPKVAEAIRGLGVTPVRSITDRESGDRVNGSFDGNEVLVAERRLGNAALESIVKHEIGHAFDATGPDGKERSEDPEFRKLVDEVVRRDPQLQRIKREQGEGFYAEIFADLFASNLNAPSRDLSISHIDRVMSKAREWVRRQMF